MGYITDLFDYTDLLGKDFAYGGRGPDHYDCYGLCIEVYKRVGRKLPEFNSATEPSIIDNLINQGKELFQKIEEPKPLCLVTFMIIPPYVSHVGVVLNPPYFIHILEKSKVTVERLDNPIWQRRIKGFWIPR